MSTSVRKLAIMLSGEQNHRCATCAVVLKLTPGSFDSAAVAKIDPREGRHWENLVAVCRACAAARQSMHLAEFYDLVRQQGRPTSVTKAVRLRNKTRSGNEVLARVMARVETELTALGIGYPYDGEIFGGADLPPEAEDGLVEKLVNRAIKRQRAGTPRKSRRWKSIGKQRRYSRLHRTLLGEAQNNRCCYCSEPVRYDIPRHPDYATFEHVIERKHDGPAFSYYNLVIACSLCNNEREHLGLTANAYWEYVQQNRRRSWREPKRYAQLVRKAVSCEVLDT